MAGTGASVGAYARGEIDPQTAEYIEGMLSQRFDQIATERGTSLARAELADSTITQRIMGEIDANEQQALADALVQESSRRQQMGQQMQAGQQQAQGQAVGSAIQTLENLYSAHQEEAMFQQWMANQQQQGGVVTQPGQNNLMETRTQQYQPGETGPVYGAGQQGVYGGKGVYCLRTSVSPYAKVPIPI